MEREKSFDEARTAVQSQIEKIFLKTANNAKGNPTKKNDGGMTTTMHASNATRMSRRDQDQDAKGKKSSNPTLRRRVPSMEPKVSRA